MGVNTFSFSLGVAVGPLLGGFLTSESPAPAFLWPAAFSVVVLVVVIAWLPSDALWKQESEVTHK